MKELIKALEVIRNTCMDHFYTSEGCKECPLGTSDDMCNVKEYPEPNKWPVNTEVWRALGE